MAHPLPPPPLSGRATKKSTFFAASLIPQRKIIKLLGGKGNIMAVEKNNMEKRARGSNIIFPVILRLLGRISSGEEGKGTEILGMKIEIKI